jgi:hypothetical protein
MHPVGTSGHHRPLSIVYISQDEIVARKPVENLKIHPPVKKPAAGGKRPEPVLRLDCGLFFETIASVFLKANG